MSDWCNRHGSYNGFPNCQKCAMESQLTGLSPSMDDYKLDPEIGFTAVRRVETLPPVVSPELPCLTDDQRAACLMAAKRLIDASISGDSVHLECARGYIRDL